MEKRIHKRIFKRLEVKFTSDNINRTGITSNLSENGMFVRTRKVLNAGTNLDLELTLPSGEIIKLCGRVARAIITPLHNKDGMGIELMEIPPNYIEFIKTLYGVIKRRSILFFAGLLLLMSKSCICVFEGRYIMQVRKTHRIIFSIARAIDSPSIFPL